MKNVSGLFLAAILVASMLMAGCHSEVPQGYVGRVKRHGGWRPEIHSPGYHECWGHDRLYLVDATEKTYKETMEILVGGKINLTITVSARCAIDQTKEELVRGIFDKVGSDKENRIQHKNLYETYLEMIVESTPRTVIGPQPDIQTVVANRAKMTDEIRKQIIERSKETPMKILNVEITNWDWPDSVTRAQEKLVDIQLSEEREKALVKADLQKAKGRLAVEQANKAVEKTKAETVAESIDIIKKALKDNPEYLQWHTIRVLGEAASGPNNAFFVFPYNLPGLDAEKINNQAMLKQLLTQAAEETAKKKK